MCLCGRTCVSAEEAVSFHGSMQDWSLLGEHSNHPLFLQHSSCLPEA